MRASKDEEHRGPMACAGPYPPLPLRASRIVSTKS